MTPLDPETAPAESQPLIEASKQLTGGAVINVFRQMAVSPTTFQGYLDLAGTLQQGALDRRVQEAIAVGVSDFDGCTYWLSIHSAVAEQLGLSVAERQRAQRFTADDPKLAAALAFAGEVARTRGHPSDEAFARVREAGYSDAEILEMIAHVALTTFSNYVNETVQTEVDIPRVEPVQPR